jgi:molybdate transport system regulatory protein
MARLTLRLDFAPGQAIGHGKIRLLEAVRDHGSISAAGRTMRMSYRRAWLLAWRAQRARCHGHYHRMSERFACSGDRS